MNKEKLVKTPVTRVLDNAAFMQEVAFLLMEGKQVRMRIKGRSMMPFLLEGDEVILEAPAPGELDKLKRGRIVLAKYEKGFVLHRFSGRKAGRLKLSGDNNRIKDEWVAPCSVIAVVRRAYRGQRRLPVYTCWQLMKAWLRHTLGLRGYSLKGIWNKIRKIK